MSKIKAYYFFIAGALLLVIGYFLTVREVRAEYEAPEEFEETEEPEEPEPAPKKRRIKKEPEPEPDLTVVQDAETLMPDEKQD